MKTFLPFHKCDPCFVLIIKYTLLTIGMEIQILETKEVSTLEHVLKLNSSLAIQ